MKVEQLSNEDFFRFDAKNSPVPDRKAIAGELTREEGTICLRFKPQTEMIKWTAKNNRPFVTVRFESFERFQSGVCNFYLKG